MNFFKLGAFVGEACDKLLTVDTDRIGFFNEIHKDIRKGDITGGAARIGKVTAKLNDKERIALGIMNKYRWGNPAAYSRLTDEEQEVLEDDSVWESLTEKLGGIL